MAKVQLVEMAQRNPEVQAFIARNPAYFVEDTALSQADLSSLAAKYPVIYGGIQAPLYQLKFSASNGESILVLLDSSAVQRVFAVQSIKVG